MRFKQKMYITLQKQQKEQKKTKPNHKLLVSIFERPGQQKNSWTLFMDYFVYSNREKK